MEINKLRLLIKEAVAYNLKEIEEAAENAAMEAKLNAYNEAIEKVNKKIETAESLEEMKELVDDAKLNELKKHLKLLEKNKVKLEKLQEKKNKKKVVTDEPVDDTVDEGSYYNEDMNLGEENLSDEEKEELRKKAEQNPSLALPEGTLNESFLKMQKLAGVITEAQYNQKKRLIESQLEEISLSGALNKIKDKIASLPVFDKLINSVVAKMSEEDKENFKAKFNLNEAKGVPSLEDIMAKVDAINPNKDVKTPEDLKEGAEETVDKIVYEVVRLVKNLAGINLLALGGIPFGAFIAYLMGSSWGIGTVVGGAISLIASLIIHGICRKLLGLSGDDELVGESDATKNKLNEITIEWTPEIGEKLKSGGFIVKMGYGGDKTIGSISKDGSQILGYYATDSKSQDYPVSKSDPLYGKQIVYALSDNNELAKILK